jgi:hypothetical protein
MKLLDIKDKEKSSFWPPGHRQQRRESSWHRTAFLSPKKQKQRGTFMRNTGKESDTQALYIWTYCFSPSCRTIKLKRTTVLCI